MPARPGQEYPDAGHVVEYLTTYGDWTGPVSATLIGVGRPARDTVRQIAELLS